MAYNEIELLKESLNTKSPILFLGAGFSLGAKSKKGCPLVLGKDLAKNLYNYVIKPSQAQLINDGAEMDDVTSDADRGKLKEVCNFIEEFGLTDKRDAYFQDAMRQCAWDKSTTPFQNLALYPWEYIYTLNIDDLVENIYTTQRIPYEKWTRSSAHYEFPKGKVLLIKLHGDVLGNASDYVFCEKEYNKYISENEWMIRQFTTHYFQNDIIFVGTEFQENDIDIALMHAYGQRCSNKDNHYFFISPGKPSRALKKRMEKNSNVFHIPWSAKEFLDFIATDVSKNQSVISSLRSNGFVIWNEELKVKGPEKSTELYFGSLPVPDDFVYEYDIPRAKEGNRVEQFIQDAKYGCISIFGDSYVGKTCFSKRILSNLVYAGYYCFYLHHTESNYVSFFESKLKEFSGSDKIAICFENAAMQYKLIRDLIERNRCKYASLIVITTAEYSLHETKIYQLDGIPTCKIELKPTIDRLFAKNIYKTLKNHSYLNHLEDYGKQSEVEHVICRLNDIIEVLYVAHEATGFTDYFKGWIIEREFNEEHNTFLFFYSLAQLGVSYIKISEFSFLARAVGNPQISCGQLVNKYSRVCIREKDSIHFHCTRMLRKVLNIDSLLLTVWIRNLAELLGQRIQENEKNSLSDLFECVLSAKNLHKILGFTWQDLKELYDTLNQSCNRLSYYWMQRGIAYRELHEYENARNSFANAKKVHGRETYQIKHAIAKNELEWGIYLVDRDITVADSHFDTGCNDMQEIIRDPRYSNAVHYSIHAYIDMNLDYYSKKKCCPESFQWDAWEKLLESYLGRSETDAEIKLKLIDKMKAFALNFSLSYDEPHYKLLIK